MRKVMRTATAIGGLGLSLIASTALAGDCRYGPAGPDCTSSVITHKAPALSADPTHVYSQAPMGHLRSVQYLGSPSVNITRVHSQHNPVELSDRPHKFTEGCFPQSTHYCRQGAHQASVQPEVHIAPPAPVAPPLVHAPVAAPAAPVVTERVVHVGGGYDPSKFTPRTYGSNELTPGIAYIPTSIVNRSHEDAMAVLNSGKTQPQPVVSGGIVPHPSMVSPAPAPMTISPAPTVYPGSVSMDGSYYEKVSGATTIGGMQATQVICKRPAPQPQPPTMNVPTPVYPSMPQGCETTNTMPMGHSEPVLSGRYGALAGGPEPIQSSRFSSSRYGH